MHAKLFFYAFCILLTRWYIFEPRLIVLSQSSDCDLIKEMLRKAVQSFRNALLRPDWWANESSHTFWDNSGFGSKAVRDIPQNFSHVTLAQSKLNLLCCESASRPCLYVQKERRMLKSRNLKQATLLLPSSYYIQTKLLRWCHLSLYCCEA